MARSAFLGWGCQPQKKMNQPPEKTRTRAADFEVISFDVGFTLIYPEPPVGEVYAKIAGRFGYHLEAGEVHSRFKQAWKTRILMDQQAKIQALAKEDQAYRWWKEIFQASVGDTVAPGDLEAMFPICFNEYARGRQWRVYPEVVHTLTALRSLGLRLVVLSNWDRRLLQTLNELRLDGFFERIYISTLIGYAKPDPRAFHYVVEDLNISPAVVLHVGDTPEEDILGAQRANIRAVCIDRIGKNKSLPGQIPVISSLAELLD